MEDRSHTRNNCVKNSLYCAASKHWLTLCSRQTNRDPGRGSAWEISVTLTLDSRPGAEQRASMWMSGIREVPGKSRVLTHTTECHSPEQIGSRWSQIFSWLQPGKKRECNKQWEKWGEGLGEERGQGFVCVRWGGLEKKGRMLRTVAEEVEGISSRVPTVSLEQSWAQFFRYPLGALGGSTPLTLMLKATGKW